MAKKYYFNIDINMGALISPIRVSSPNNGEITINLNININLETGKISLNTNKNDPTSEDFEWVIPEFSQEKIKFGKKEEGV